MPDFLQPIGFWSYTSSDDTASRGRLSQLRRLLADHLQLRVGREPKVHIFQDVGAIPPGTGWRKEIQKALDASSFFIPIVTPAFLQSQECCHEVMFFLAREQALGRDDLIFPLHYIDVDDLDPSREGDVRDPAVLALLRARQMIDFRPLRLRDPTGEAVTEKLDAFAASLRSALRRQIKAPGAAPSAAAVTSAAAPSTITPPAPASAAPPPPASPTRSVAPPPVVPIPVPAAPAIVSPPGSPLPGTVVREGPDYPEMVLIPAGEFVMGVSEEESKREGADDAVARPLHKVTFARPFWLGKYPVTRGEYAAFVAAACYDRDGGAWRGPGFEQTDRHPVVNISAEDAEAYVAWLNRMAGPCWRLPSEAEWEYAARAGTSTARYWGDGREQACRFSNVANRRNAMVELLMEFKMPFDANEYFDCDDGFKATAPVGSFLPNAFGLYDMLGNVWEWTADKASNNYNGAPRDGSIWTTGSPSDIGVRRGGSWGDGPRNTRCGCRSFVVRGGRYSDAGFRLARTSF